MVERTHTNREKGEKQQKGHKKQRKIEWDEQNKLRNFGTSLLMYPY